MFLIRYKNSLTPLERLSCSVARTRTCTHTHTHTHTDTPCHRGSALPTLPNTHTQSYALFRHELYTYTKVSTNKYIVPTNDKPTNQFLSNHTYQDMLFTWVKDLDEP